jgi:3-hydroxyacyl-CoA dehydrogenase
MGRIAVVGCGLVGRAWAISFARAGHQVRLWDQQDGAAAAAVGRIGALLPDLQANGLLRGADPAEVMARIEVAATMRQALAGAVHVQENTPEDLATKQAVFRALDEAADPETVLASSTSGLLPSKFSEGLPGKGRCLVAHPINPPYLIPAAEVVPAPWTRPEVVERTAALLRDAGHAPIVMNRETDGFVINRLQGALLDEAFRLVADGFASPEDVDVAIRDGLALRWSFMGPFETIDLNAPGGVRDYVARYGPLYWSLKAAEKPIDWTGPVLDRIEADRRAALPLDQLGERSAWRDRRLMALAAHKQKAKADIGE